MAEEDFDEFDEEDDDDGKGGSKALTKKLEELKRDALERFDRIAGLFEKVHKIYDKEGYGTPAYLKAQQALSEELMTIRFTAKTIEKLCDLVRTQVDDVRKKERELRRIIVDKCGFPQEEFIRDFSGYDKNGNRVASQPAQPEVGREAGRRRQAVEHGAGAQHSAGAGTAAEAGRHPVARGGAARRSSRTSTSA